MQRETEVTASAVRCGVVDSVDNGEVGEHVCSMTRRRDAQCVLVVEDDREVRESIGDLLRVEGYLPIEAASGREALHYLERLDRTPCIVLLDLVMPDIDGTQVLKFIREADHLYTIPVAVVTAVERPNGLGDVRIVKKPMGLSDLMTHVQECCG